MYNCIDCFLNNNLTEQVCGIAILKDKNLIQKINFPALILYGKGFPGNGLKIFSSL